MTSAYTSIDDIDDVVIAGTGGAGLSHCFGDGRLRAKDSISHQGPSNTQPYGGRSRGMAALLANMGDGDNWRDHKCDTKGSDWLGDQDAIEYPCREAAPAVPEGHVY